MRGRRLGLEGRLVFVGVALVLTVAVLAVVLVDAVESSRARARASADTLRAAERVQGLIIDLETGLRGYQLTGDETFLDSFRRARLEMPGELRRLRSLVRQGSRRRAEVDVLARRIDAYVDGYAPRLRDDVHAGSPRVVDLTREGRRHVNEMRRRLARFRALQEGVQELRRREADRASDRAIVVGIVGSAVALAFVALSALYLRRLFVPALLGLITAARRIAADDLDARVPRRGRAELGELEAAFNSMAERLQAGQAEPRRYGETNVAMLDAVFRQSPGGLAFVDPQLRPFQRVLETREPASAAPACSPTRRGGCSSSSTRRATPTARAAPASPGPVVGIGLRRFHEERLTVGAGEALVLYTDGLTDAQAPHRIDPPPISATCWTGRRAGRPRWRRGWTRCSTTRSAPPTCCRATTSPCWAAG